VRGNTDISRPRRFLPTPVLYSTQNAIRRLPLHWNGTVKVNDIRNETLKELKTSLEPFLGDRLQRMILFGSMARGDYRDDSDIDVAIVIRRLTRELKHEILDRVAEVELKHLMPVSVLVFSEEEFNRLKRRERRIALDIEREGVPV
jgi:predicted nucleotidyltransferase